MKFNKILEKKDIIKSLEKYQILNQYKKAKENLLSWNNTKVFFKERKPKWSWIFYFRINKKFRALWFIEDGILYVYKIDTHQ